MSNDYPGRTGQISSLYYDYQGEEGRQFSYGGHRRPLSPTRDVSEQSRGTVSTEWMVTHGWSLRRVVSSTKTVIHYDIKCDE